MLTIRLTDKIIVVLAVRRIPNEVRDLKGLNTDKRDSNLGGLSKATFYIKPYPNKSAAMLGKPGPFQVIEEGGCGAVEDPVSPPRRRFSCRNYELCLNLAAALNWDNFTCRGCCEEVNESLLWRARQALKKDNMACRLCEIPEIQTHCTDVKTDVDERVVAKKVAYQS